MGAEEARIRAKIREKIAQERREYARDPDDLIFQCASDGQRGDARLLVKLLKDRYVFDHASGRWYRWDGHFWVEDEVNAILVVLDEVVGVYELQAQQLSWQATKALKQGKESVAKESERKRSIFLKKIACLQKKDWRRHVLEFAAAGPESLGITGREWDQHPHLLACPNGVVDLRDGSLNEGTPGGYLKTICPTEWRGLQNHAPHWHKFLLEVFDNDEELIAFLKRLLGYSVSGQVLEHLLPILWGGGRNGKGTLLETLHHILGELSGPVPSELLLKQVHPRSSAAPSPDVMALRGKRLVWGSETDEGRKLDTAKVKWLVGGDTLVGRDPHGKRMVNFNPTHTLFLLTNHRPRIAADDEAMWERVLLIPFTVAFVDNAVAPHQRQRDIQMAERLKKETPGILAWLVQGFLEWQERGLQPPPKVLVANQEYQQNEDLLKDFFDDCCMLAPDARAKGGELYEAYKNWCLNNGLKPLNGKSFGEKLKARFSWKKSGIVIYEGIGLKL